MQNERFAGIARLYGQPAFEFLQQAHVAVVGIGGVGSWAAEALARSGVGKISLFDMDTICLSNSNRQIHAMQHSIGHYKVEEMAQRIRAINPDCQVHSQAQFLQADNIGQYIHHEFDFVLDCIDSLASKAALLNWCKRNKLPFIATGGAGGKTNPSMVQIADLNKTIQDPLAARLRASLKRDYGFNAKPGKNLGIPCVFSSEQPKKISAPEGQTDSIVRFGTVMTVTATFGLTAAAYALNKLVAKGSEA